MQLYFIRHGQSENNLLWEETQSSEGRSQDPHLTEAGRQQAQRLAAFLSGNGDALTKEFDFQNTEGFGLTHLYTSLMARAVETGVAIAEATGLPLVAWEEIHEWGGIYQNDKESREPVGQPGPNRDHFERHYPTLVLPETLGETGWWNRPFESPTEVPTRVQRFLESLMERHNGTDDRVAIVSHGGFYNNVIKTLLKLSEGTNHWFILNNAAITRIDFHQDGVDWAYMNRTDFLPPDLIT